MNTPEDKAELVALWTSQAEWDQIDEKTWEHRFGKADIVVAIDEATDKIVGQIVFIPVNVWLNGREIKAYRPFATFLVKEARSFQNLNPLSHPMFKMYQIGIAAFREQGAGLILMLPDPMWARMLQLAPDFQIAKFPLFSLKLPLSNDFALSEGYSMVEIHPTDKRLDELWEKTAKLYKYSTIRNSETLTWKTSHHQYFYLGIERNGELVGFSASRFKARDRQWLICDILAADLESLDAIIRATCLQADEFKRENPNETLDKTAILATELILPIVQDLGFYKDSYNFIFVVQRLDESLKMEDIAPSKWYVSANN
jgi:hypothetical protein